MYYQKKLFSGTLAVVEAGLKGFKTDGAGCTTGYGNGFCICYNVKQNLSLEGSDGLKKRILEILEQDDRISPKDIAIMLNLPEEEVVEQIAQMEEQGIIVKYHALVNWEKVDDDLVEAMIAVEVEPERDVGFDDIAERISNFPEVRALYLMSGSYDLSVFVTGRDIREVARFVSTKLATIDRVKSTVTYFVLRKYKQEGVLLDGKVKPKRMAVSP